MTVAKKEKGPRRAEAARRATCSAVSPFPSKHSDQRHRYQWQPVHHQTATNGRILARTRPSLFRFSFTPHRFSSAQKAPNWSFFDQDVRKRGDASRIQPRHRSMRRRVQIQSSSTGRLTTNRSRSRPRRHRPKSRAFRSCRNNRDNHSRRNHTDIHSRMTDSHHSRRSLDSSHHRSSRLRNTRDAPLRHGSHRHRASAAASDAFASLRLGRWGIHQRRPKREERDNERCPNCSFHEFCSLRCFWNYFFCICSRNCRTSSRNCFSSCSMR